MNKEIIEKKESWINLMEKMPISLCILTIITDDKGNPVDFVYDYVNKAFLQFYKVNKKDYTGKRFLQIRPNTDIKYIYSVWKSACQGEVCETESYAPWCDKYIRHLFFPLCKNVCGCIVEDNTVNHRMFEIIQKISMGKAELKDYA